MTIIIDPSKKHEPKKNVRYGIDPDQPWVARQNIVVTIHNLRDEDMLRCEIREEVLRLLAKVVDRPSDEEIDKIIDWVLEDD